MFDYRWLMWTPALPWNGAPGGGLCLSVGSMPGCAGLRFVAGGLFSRSPAAIRQLPAQLT